MIIPSSARALHHRVRLTQMGSERCRAEAGFEALASDRQVQHRGPHGRLGTGQGHIRERPAPPPFVDPQTRR
jgi:hypothetical protein